MKSEVAFLKVLVLILSIKDSIWIVYNQYINRLFKVF